MTHKRNLPRWQLDSAIKDMISLKETSISSSGTKYLVVELIRKAYDKTQYSGKISERFRLMPQSAQFAKIFAAVYN